MVNEAALVQTLVGVVFFKAILDIQEFLQQFQIRE